MSRQREVLLAAVLTLVHFVTYEVLLALLRANATAPPTSTAGSILVRLVATVANLMVLPIWLLNTVVTAPLPQAAVFALLLLNSVLYGVAALWVIRRLRSQSGHPRRLRR